MNVKFSHRRNNLFLILGSFFLTNAIVAEFIGAKIFSLEKTIGIAPLNLKIWGDSYNMDMTAGVLLWPFVFILTDIINEYFGPKGVRKLSYIAVLMLVYSFVMVRAAMGLEGADFWQFSAQNLGIKSMTNAFNSVFGQGLMIILGSLVAFLIGQIIDAFVFAQIKKKSQNRFIWLRATGSTVVSQFIDSYVVLVVVDEPQGAHAYGSTVAVPVAKQIIDALLVVERIAPSKPVDLNKPTKIGNGVFAGS